LPKSEVRRLAAEAGLPTASKKDSQGICFIGQVKMNDFMSAYLGDNPGPVVTADGRVIGSHRGLHYHTLGQRKGLGIPSNTDHEAFVVVEKRVDSNELVVAFDRSDSPGLYHTSCVVRSFSFINETPADGARLLARPRYRDSKRGVTLQWIDANRLSARFDDPQRALTPGQVLALYDGERLVGGGTVESRS
jgi:tRNA-specific 2-thiouridylase